MLFRSLEKRCNCYNKLCYQKIGLCILSNKYNKCRSEKSYLNYLISFDAELAYKFTQNYYVYKLKFDGENRFTGFSYKFDNNDKWISLLSTIMKDSTNCVINTFNYPECIYQIDTKNLQAGNTYSNDIYQECLIAKNIGYIRYKGTDNNYWSLLRKNIIQ